MTAPIWNRYVESAAERYGVPPALVDSVINAESSGRAGAVSRVGAGGLMQLMPDTFAELRQKYGLGPDRMDPQTNINAGTAYLGQLYKQFGNWPDAIAAYNAGPNRWAQVKAGTRDAPRETQAYVPKVLAGFGQDTVGQGPVRTQTQGADVAPGLIRPQPGQTSGMGSLFAGPRVGSLTGLLEVDESKNYADGLGLLGNFGQTESQPPRTDPAAMPGTTQTDRMDVSGRINELLQQYLQKPQAAGPSQLQYALAGAQKGMAGLSGVHDRKVGIGEMLGALGGGVTTGGLAYDEAQQQRQGGELDKLLKIGGYQNQNRTAKLNEANSIIENRLKDAQTKKALAPTSDADRYKVVGKQVYDTQEKRFIQAPGGPDQSGPLEGTGIDAQMYNIAITLQQKLASGQTLTPQETYQLELARRHLTQSRQTVDANGKVVDMAPAPLPPYPGAQQPSGQQPQPAPAPNAAAPQAADTTVVRTPSGATVTTVGGGLPQGEQTALRKQVDTLTKLRGSATALTDNVTKTGLQIGGFGGFGGRQSALYEDLQTQLRLANELGVLNGPDERKLLEQISNPTAFMTMLKGGGGISYFAEQMKVLQEKIDREIGQHEERLGIKKPDGGGGSGAGGDKPTTVLKLDSQGNILK